MPNWKTKQREAERAEFSTGVDEIHCQSLPGCDPHDWFEWEVQSYNIRQCSRCSRIEALGHGGWTEIE